MRLQGCRPNAPGKASTKKGAGRIQIGTPWRAAPVRDRDDRHPSRKAPWRPSWGQAAEGPTAHSEVPSPVALHPFTNQRSLSEPRSARATCSSITCSSIRPMRENGPESHSAKGELSQHGHSTVTPASATRGRRPSHSLRARLGPPYRDGRVSNCRRLVEAARRDRPQGCRRRGRGLPRKPV